MKEQRNSPVRTWKASFRNALILLLCLVLMLTSFPPFLSAEGNRMNEELLPVWAADDITSLRELGIIHGDLDGTFQPNRQVTRAEMAAWLNRIYAAQSMVNEGIVSPSITFTDVNSEWFAEEVHQAARLGLVAGYPDGSFRPQAALNRLEAAVMLNQLIQEQQANPAIKFADDEHIPAWAAQHVYALREANIIHGYPDGSFGGRGLLTRAEAAVMLGQVMKRTHDLDYIVLDDAGNPLTGASVRIHPQGKYTPVYVGDTDDEGKISGYDTLAEGPYDLTVSNGNQLAYQLINIQNNGEPLHNRIIRTKQAATFTGQVVDNEDEPVAGALLAFRSDAVFFTLTDEDGRFAVYVLPEETYQVALLSSEKLQQQAKDPFHVDDLIHDQNIWQDYLSWLDLPALEQVDCTCIIMSSDVTYTSPHSGDSKDIGIWQLEGTDEPSQPSSSRGSETKPDRGSAPVPPPSDENGQTEDEEDNSNDGSPDPDEGDEDDHDPGGGDEDGETEDTSPPAAPTGLDAVAGDGQVILSWDFNQEDDLEGYRVYTSNDNGASWTVVQDVGKVTQYEAKGLTNGLTYLFAISAYDSYGNESPRSGPIAATPVAVEPPDDLELPPNPVTVSTPLPIAGTPPFIDTIDFLYQGDEPIQTGLDEDTLIPEIVSVLRGTVLNRSGEPLPGVTIRILNEDRYGSTLSRADGQFDMIVNGGTMLQIEYKKEGYMTVQRKIHVMHNTFATAPDVVLNPYDDKVTHVALDGHDEIQVAMGSEVTDADGTRQAVLVIPENTSAEMVMEDGSRIPMPEMNFRATEYTVGETGEASMPGELPTFVGYTYAVELSADEAVEADAVEVRFNQALYLYVDNYLEFPTGEVVPIGYYNRQQGKWIPSDNGRVIEIIDIPDGVAEIDIDGDGEADEMTALAELGFDEAELLKLGQLYEPGDTLWRSPIEHFTPWDCNWPYGPPEDAISPPDRKPNHDRPDIEDPCRQQGSIIGCQDQSLGQQIPLPGTGMSLHYNSKRTAGYMESNVLDITVTPSNLPASVEEVELTIEIAGRIWKETFDPEPNLSYRFIWDGEDVYGRLLHGHTKYKVSIGYAYKMVYYSSPNAFAQSFGRLSNSRGVRIGAVRSIPRVTTVRSWAGTIETPQNPYQESGIAGWSLDQHHILDRISQDVYTGDGRKLLSNFNDYTISEAYRKPGWPDGAIMADIGPDGQLYIMTDHEVDGKLEKAILTVDREGNAEFVSDLPPISNSLYNYRLFRIARDGTLYIATSAFPRWTKIWRKAPGGEWEHFAGSGESPENGYLDVEDGADPLESVLDYLDDLEIANDGTVYFLSRHILYKIGDDGKIAKLGGGLAVPGVEEGEMTPQNVGRVDDFEIGPDDSLYVLNTINFRRITPDGKISLIAKSGPRNGEPIRDGTHKSEEKTFVTLYFELDDYGNIYFFNRHAEGNRGLYKLATNGIFYNIGRQYELEFSLNENNLMDVSPDGELYIYYFGGLPITNNTAVLNRLSPSVSGQHAMSIVDHNGQLMYDFDPASGLVQTIRHTLNGATMYTAGYDTEGRLESITDGYGNQVTIERDEDGIPTAIVTDSGLRTRLTVEDGELTGVTVPGVGDYTMTYDELGLLTSFSGPDGGVSEYKYNDVGRLISANHNEQGLQTLQFDPIENGYRVTHTKPGNLMYTYEVTVGMDEVISRKNTDPNGAVIESQTSVDGDQMIFYPDGSTVTKEFMPDPRFGMRAPVMGHFEQRNPGGGTLTFSEEREVTLRDPNDPLSVEEWSVVNTLNGHRSTIHYDADTRTYTETSAEGHTVITRVDEHGKTIAHTEQGLDPLTFEYDERGRLTEITQGDQTVSYVYDEALQQITVTDEAGISKQYQYNDLGWFTSVNHEGDLTYGKTLNASGQLTGLTMPDHTEYKVSYDSLGRMITYAPAASGEGVQRVYGTNGQLDQIMLPGARNLTYTYDSGGRMTGMDDEIERTFIYADGTDRVNRIFSEHGGRSQSVMYTYDGGQITGAQWAGVANGEFAYEYDDLFQLINITGSVTGTTYGPADVLNINLAVDWNRDQQLIQQGPFQFQRGAISGRVDRIQDDKMDITITYDKSGREHQRVYTLNGENVYQETLSYNTRGLLNEKTVTTLQEVMTYSYEYDHRGQLIKVLSTGHLEEFYTYDENRNRISRQVNEEAPQVSIMGELDRLESTADIDYVYDAAGYLISRGEDTFHYGTHGELLQAQVDGEWIHYTYDALGRRVAREDSTGTTTYLYANPMAPLIPTAEISPDGEATIYHYDEEGLLLGLERDGQRYYVITDRVGTPSLVLNEAGEVVKELVYDHYGVKLSDSNESFALSIGFAGGLKDAKTGLTRFGLRDYDAFSGRWTAIDPMLYDSGQGNLYTYVNNNPVQLRDPCGMFCIGASAYAGAGGGAQICFNSDGMSVCGELGFGAGGGLEMNPFQDLADNGLGIQASMGASMGPAGVNVGYLFGRFDDCFQHGKTGGADLGPLTFDFTDPANTGLQTFEADSLINPRAGAHAKVTGKACGRWYW